MRQYEGRHPIGTRARLALALLLYTAQRPSDVVRLGHKMVHNGWLNFTQAKNAKRKPFSLDIPILAELGRIIEATTTLGRDTYLVTESGKPFTVAGFGNRFRKWCDEAGLPHCSAHGLRKAGSARLAELGACDREIMAIPGHQLRRKLIAIPRVPVRRSSRRVLWRNGNRDGTNKCPTAVSWAVPLSLTP